MTFTCTYRNKNGALDRRVIEANSRADVFAKLKSEGIVPTSIVEGGKVSTPNRQQTSSGKNGVLVAILVALAVIIGVGVWLVGKDTWNSKDGKDKEAPKVQAKPKAKPTPIKAEPKKKIEKPVSPAETNAVPVEPKPAKPAERHDTVSIHTNNLGKVVEKWIGADGKLHMSVRYARKPVFDNASDDQLAMAVGGNGTQAIAPIPMTAASEQEFLESLKKPIVIEPDDSEQVKQLKAAVMDARAEMKKMIDNGMSYKDALAEHQKLVNENVDTRNECMAELKRLVDDGDVEGAKKYLKTMNVALGQMGIPELTMPKSREELNAARERRRAERQKAQQEAAAAKQQK